MILRAAGSNTLVKTTGQTVRKETIATVSCPFASYAVLFNQGRVDWCSWQISKDEQPLTSDYLHHSRVNRMQKGTHFVQQPLLPRDSRTMISGEKCQDLFSLHFLRRRPAGEIYGLSSYNSQFSTLPIFLLWHSGICLIKKPLTRISK